MRLLKQASGSDPEMQKEAEHDDMMGGDERLGEYFMNVYYMCPYCGIYMSAKMWAHRKISGDKNARA